MSRPAILALIAALGAETRHRTGLYRGHPGAIRRRDGRELMVIARWCVWRVRVAIRALRGAMG